MLLNVIYFTLYRFITQIFDNFINFVSSPFRETSNIYDGSSFCAGL